MSESKKHDRFRVFLDAPERNPEWVARSLENRIEAAIRVYSSPESEPEVQNEGCESRPRAKKAAR